MRYLDIAVAVMVGVAAIACITTWTPAQADQVSRQLQTKSILRDGVVSFVDREGMALFASSSWPKICSALSAASNSTFTISGEVGTSGCGGLPPPGGISVQSTFTVGLRRVTLVAWSGAAA